MVEAGVRFTNDLYVTFKLDPDSGDMQVYVETIAEGENVTAIGTVTWGD